MRSKRSKVVLAWLASLAALVGLSMVSVYRLKPAAHKTPQESVADTLSLLKEGDIAFVTPDSMSLSDSKVVETRIAQSLSDDLTKGLELLGTVQVDQIKVFGVMGARLTGARFEITPITPAVQPVPSSGFTRWQWEVRPKDWGHQKLYLNICVELDSRSGRQQYCPSVYEREIAIKVNRGYAATHFVATMRRGRSVRLEQSQAC